MDPASAADEPHDVRMRGFARRTTVEAALGWIDEHARRLESELVSLESAGGRVLAAAVTSGVDVPGFDRSMMDGFALRGDQTQGAGTYNRRELEIVGESLPGRPYAGTLSHGQAVRIMTGAPIPAGADTVLPAERVDVSGNQLNILDEVPPGKNIGRKGEDVTAGTRVLSAGRVLRPQDLGVLASIGAVRVEVVRQPRVRIVITGNELLPAGSAIVAHKIIDANGPMLAALVARDGGIPINPAIIPDEPDAILAAMQDDADLVLVSGGSSVGQEDFAPSLLAKHGELAIHGVAMRPSSPAGMGLLMGKAVFLLPGNPVSCLCAYDFFASRALRLLGGRKQEWPYPSERRKLRRKLVSTVGRVDYARVRIVEDRVEPISISGASILSSTTRADGFVVVPADSEGYPEGAEVVVYFYDS
jgi:molybdopterin molybdotransferase